MAEAHAGISAGRGWARDADVGYRVRGVPTLVALACLAAVCIAILGADRAQASGQSSAVIDAAAPAHPGGAVASALPAALSPSPTGGLDALVRRLSDPNLAFVLFLLGVAGLLYEIVHPGVVLAGVGGALALTLAVLEFRLLPVRPGALALLLAGLALMLIDAKLAGHGAASALGVVALIAGGLLLYQPGHHNRVDPLLLGLVVALLTLVISVVARKVLAARRLPAQSSSQAYLGAGGIVTEACAPDGRVRVTGRSWRARTADGLPIGEGVRVEVTAVDGLTLEVAPEDTGPGLDTVRRLPPGARER